jgi:hypothetical protein
VTTIALAAVAAGTLLTLSPLDPQAVRDAHCLINPDALHEQDADVTADLALIDRITAWLPRCTERTPALEINLRERHHAEDRLLAAYGHVVPTEAQRQAARRASARATAAVHSIADRAHPPADCPACRAWEDCPAADRAHRDALHIDWVTRWHTAA